MPLPAIRARLGHEGSTTTVDRYGHLVHRYAVVCRRDDAPPPDEEPSPDEPSPSPGLTLLSMAADRRRY